MIKSIQEIVNQKCRAQISECNTGELFEELDRALDAQYDCEYGCTIDRIRLPSKNILKKFYIFLDNSLNNLNNFDPNVCNYLNKWIEYKGNEYKKIDENIFDMQNWKEDMNTIFSNKNTLEQCPNNECCKYSSSISIPPPVRRLIIPEEDDEGDDSELFVFSSVDTEDIGENETHASHFVALPIRKIIFLTFLVIITVLFIIFFSSKNAKIKTFLGNIYNWMILKSNRTMNRNSIAYNDDFLLYSTNESINIGYV
ncbi:variable surface protein [Plasmodium gonderi]|uniref:Variable surface protein n=1 Tax=Plasmodium gonderi TaxID=77519 RepID=A0A1Y1JTB1_PLAGO|nr:variable surface protein [Plasmodium gonderi]GAW84678.1 variable surface protein [Plasmodium gonderi]